MTKEIFKIAQELYSKIRRLSFELERWKSSVKIISIKIKDDVRKTTDIQHDESFIDFQPIKEFIIKDLSEKLEEAKELLPVIQAFAKGK